LKPTLITSLKKIDDPSHLVQHNHLVQSIATKRPQAWSSQFQLMYFSRKVEIDHFLLYLVRQNVPIRTGPDLFEINNNEAPNEEIWRHKLYHNLYIVYVSKLDWVHLIYLWKIFQSKTQTLNIENKLSIKATDMKIISQN
jgi:hypothetical protein